MQQYQFHMFSIRLKHEYAQKYVDLIKIDKSDSYSTDLFVILFVSFQETCAYKCKININFTLIQTLFDVR